MLCPTCGHDEFQQSVGSDEVTCNSCGRVMMQDELVKENSERISAEIENAADQVHKDAKKELKDTLKAAFKGVKGVKIK